MASDLRKQYAARSQTSNIMDASSQPDAQRPGRRLNIGIQQSSTNVFNDEDPNGKQYNRTLPAPAPFLTDDNAVNTHGRLGGYVNQSDSLLAMQAQNQELQVEDVAPNSNEMKYNSSNDKSEENASIAREHKRRNQASSIFGDPIAEERNSGRPVYNRDLMSNVF